jgi:hypothetical protein
MVQSWGYCHEARMGGWVEVGSHLPGCNQVDRLMSLHQLQLERNDSRELSRYLHLEFVDEVLDYLYHRCWSW